MTEIEAVARAILSIPLGDATQTARTAIEAYESTPRQQTLRTVAAALGWVLPMAKAYAAEHSVGRNTEIVARAETALARLAELESGEADYGEIL